MMPRDAACAHHASSYPAGGVAPGLGIQAIHALRFVDILPS